MSDVKKTMLWLEKRIEKKPAVSVLLHMQLGTLKYEPKWPETTSDLEEIVDLFKEFPEYAKRFHEMAQYPEWKSVTGHWTEVVGLLEKDPEDKDERREIRHRLIEILTF